jgi:preprotein translocase subunit SecE
LKKIKTAERLFFKPIIYAILELGRLISEFMKKILNFIKEVREELKKVNWPTRQETVNYTLIVIGISLAVAAFLGGLDFIFSKIIEQFIF